MDREDWGGLAAFAVVAEERSFTRAAARLGVSASALSHTMRRLEERLRIQLLARSTRSVSTTDAGERLLDRLGPAIMEISNAVEDLGRLLNRPSGRPDYRIPKCGSNGGGTRPTAIYPELSRDCRRNPHRSRFNEHRRAAVRCRHSPWRVSRERRGGRTRDGTTADGRRRIAAVLRVTSGPVNAARPAQAPLHQLQVAVSRHALQVGVR